MSSYSITAPSSRQKWIAGTIVILYALVTITPLIWIIATGFKSGPDSISYPPKVLFQPTLEGYVNLFTTRTRGNAASRRLVLGDVAMGQLARLGHFSNRLVPTMAPWGRKGEPS